jgi:hypothetical protein
VLPQHFLLQAIAIAPNGSVTVTPLKLDDSQQGTFTLDGAAADEIIITVSAITPVTTQSTSYTYTIRRAP